jgi:predicted unusual protein kinase regulating ubiquinone biosynthesis (AarF/ABC1/UbiB family)
MSIASRQTHQGCYIKFGQFIASLVRILPDEWTGTLRYCE